MHFRFLSIFLLVFGVAVNAQAISYEEFESRLNEALRLKKQATEEVNDLASNLEKMKKKGTSIDQRQAYSLELIEVIKYIEKLNKEIAALKKLLPDVKVEPVLKLVDIVPANVPGRQIQRKHTGEDSPFLLESIRLRSFPTEIVGGRTFTISADLIWRKSFDQGPCSVPAANTIQKRLKISMGAHRIIANATDYNLLASGVAELASSVEAKNVLTRLCSDAPVDTDPDTGKRVQAAFEKDSRVSATFRFIPIRSELTEEGLSKHTYKLKTVSKGTIASGTTKAVLITETSNTAGRGSCLDNSGKSCGGLLIHFGGSGGGLAPSASLVYKQIKDGGKFIARAPTYKHPSQFGEPPRVGTIKLATTVPDIIGYTRAQAKETLEQADLQLSLSPTVRPPSIELAGKVKATTPGVGKKIGLGKSVMVTFYAKAAKVPDVLGLSRKEATQLIREAGFKSEVEVGTPAPNKQLQARVSSQKPEPNVAAKTGSLVSIMLHGPYDDTVTVPDLTNMTGREARRALGRIGLVPLVKTGKAAPSASKQGVVTHQAPSKGIKVAKGQQVELVVWGKYIPVAPRLTPDQSCNRDWPGSVSSGRRSQGGGWDCMCPDGKKWNSDRSACIKKPVLSPDQSCSRDLPGSIYSGKRTQEGALNCICPRGKEWNNNRTACIKASPARERITPELTPPPAPSRRKKGCHPWQYPETMPGPLGGSFTMCSCKYGNAINSRACLPPRPRGHQGCPPGTRKEYSKPDRLGLGCECIYGVKNGVCRTR